MSDVNDYQVGGDHYVDMEYQHWDFVVRNGIGYLHGCATKYPSRWRQKNGKVDLMKCTHYIEKIEDTDTDFVEIPHHELNMFTSQLPAQDALLVESILRNDFVGARKALAELLDEAEPVQPPREYVNPDL